MLVGAAFLPHPPVLLPAVAAGAAPELTGLRAACRDALRRVLRAQPDLVVVVGDDVGRSTYGPDARGSFAGFGVPLTTALPGAVDGDRPDRRRLPLSLAVAGWLMRQEGQWPSVRGEGLPGSTTAADAVSMGAEWAGSAARVGLVAMGDGAATLTVKAPGYLVDGAEQWQKGVTSALADVDTAAIAAITPDDAQRFRAVGRVPWQVAAGAAGRVTGQVAGVTATPWVGELLADDAPYGVAYQVALWARA